MDGNNERGFGSLKVCPRHLVTSMISASPPPYECTNWPCRTLAMPRPVTGRMPHFGPVLPLSLRCGGWIDDSGALDRYPLMRRDFGLSCWWCASIILLGILQRDTHLKEPGLCICPSFSSTEPRLQHRTDVEAGSPADGIVGLDISAPGLKSLGSLGRCGLDGLEVAKSHDCGRQRPPLDPLQLLHLMHPKRHANRWTRSPTFFPPSEFAI